MPALRAGGGEFRGGVGGGEEVAGSSAIFFREETTVGAGEDGGEFLEREEVGVEGVDERIDGIA